jgi:ATP-binding cassette subfamily B protein
MGKRLHGRKKTKWPRSPLIIEDSISGIRVVKAFTNEDYEIQRFGETCKTYKNVRAATYKFMASFVSNMHFYTGLLNIIVIFIGDIWSMQIR